jgi:hypothetical protein
MMQLMKRLVCGALLVVGYSLSAQAATVAISPSPTVVNIGDTFSLDLVGLGFDTNLDGGGLNFAFDPTVLSVNSVVINLLEWDTNQDGVINNGAGTVSDIWFNNTSLATRTGNLLFASIEFTAIGLGVSSGIALSESAGNPFGTGGALYVPLVFDQSGQVTVVPLPAAAWLLGSALLGLGALKRKKA